MRGATYRDGKLAERYPFQSTPPMRGATNHTCTSFYDMFISIHAPHAGSDFCYRLRVAQDRDFNPRPPCGERRITASLTLGWRYFNPRPPCGERLYRVIYILHYCDFNPRPPCGERHGKNKSFGGEEQFQSTPPMRGATYIKNPDDALIDISIHAPHAGSDFIGS